MSNLKILQILRIAESGAKIAESHLIFVESSVNFAESTPNQGLKK